MPCFILGIALHYSHADEQGGMTAKTESSPASSRRHRFIKHAAPGGSRKQTASATTRRERVGKHIYANALRLGDRMQRATVKDRDGE
jgi:hypothetical protein